MKLKVFFKTPNAVEVAIEEACVQITDNDARFDARDACDAVAAKFVKYGEVVTIEFDTEAGTATVVPV